MKNESLDRKNSVSAWLPTPGMKQQSPNTSQGTGSPCSLPLTLLKGSSL